MLGNGGKALICLNGKRLKLPKLLVKIAIKSENYSNIIKLFSLAEFALKSICCDIYKVFVYIVYMILLLYSSSIITFLITFPF